jgi:hypothetical protein
MKPFIRFVVYTAYDAVRGRRVKGGAGRHGKATLAPTRLGGVGNFSALFWPRRSPTSKMNNSQFRRLLLSDQAKQQDGTKPSASPASRTPGAALGARKHSSIPMTPYVPPARIDTAAF